MHISNNVTCLKRKTQMRVSEYYSNSLDTHNNPKQIKRRLFMKSIRVKITAAIVLCSLVTSLFISILSISNAGNLSNTLAKDELILTCTNSGNEINALISRIEQSVDTLTDVSMGQMIYSKFKSNNEYVDEYTKGIMKNFYKFIFFLFFF